MANWGNTDDAANSVLWATTYVKLPANTDNQANLYGNTTADAFITGATVGQFGVDQGETQALRAGANTKVTHAGWNLRTVGSGGRAGRVQNETLVAFGGNFSGSDGSDDDVVPDYLLSILTQPANATGNSTNNDIVSFSVNAASIPTGATFTYKWQKWGGSSFSNITDAGAYSNSSTRVLSVLANTASTGEIYRVQVGATGAANVVSSNAVITITT